jgi:hypothetical protein
MKIIKKTVFACLLTVACVTLGHAQGQGAAAKSDCDIQVEAKVTNPTPGRSDGKIEFKFSDTNKYKVYLLSAGEERGRKDSGKVVENLSKGIYEFIIIGVGRGRCWKEIAVTLN